MSNKIVNVGLKSQYSILDSIYRYTDSVADAVKDGQKYLGIADQNNLFMSYNFQKLCDKNNIIPVIGSDLTVREISNPARYGNIKVFSKNQDGYRALVHLVTTANTGEKEFPYITIEDIKKENVDKNLVCLTGGIEGELLDIFNDEEKVNEYFNTYFSLFGNENVYLEVCYHGVPIEKEFLESSVMLNIVKKYSIKAILTQNVLYKSADLAKTRALAVEFNHNKKNNGPKEGYEWRDRYSDYNDQFYWHSSDELAEQFKPWISLYPDAEENTVKVAEECGGDRIFIEKSLPKFPVPNGISSCDYLHKLAREGFSRRFPMDKSGHRTGFAEGKTQNDYFKQMQHELNVIERMGFVDYFLIVQDFVQWCKDDKVYEHPEKYFPKEFYDWKNIPDKILRKNFKIYVGPARGSAGGSLLAYCLGITDVIDPLKYNLYFERFLNEERVSMPDIDTDYSNRDREKVVEFAQYKYGFDHVSQIVTFQQLNPKSLFKRLAKAEDIPYAEADEMTKQFPAAIVEDGKERKLDSLEDIENLPFMQEKIKNSEKLQALFSIGKPLDKLPSTTGKHAAGVIIGAKPLQEKMALMEVDGVMVSQYEKNNSEEIGNLKMDFLGLQTEDLLQDCVSIIKRTTGKEIDVNKIPLDDEMTFELLRKGETNNVFQLESPGMKKLIKEMGPSKFEHISAILALYRPGPMQFIPDYVRGFLNPESVHYPHPIYKEVAGNTFGVLVYQEQIMALVQRMAGFTLGEADVLRRGIGHKIPKYLIDGRKQFVDGAKKCNDVDEKTANEIYDTIVKFADYGFNKAHSVAYAVISFQTAYLKAHYPVQYMCACLNLNADSASQENNKLAATIAETKRMDINILKPDIRTSEYDFSVQKDKDGNDVIRFGYRGIKSSGEALSKALIANRDKETLHDILMSVDPSLLRKDNLENMAWSGLFDEFGTRKSVIEYIPKYVEEAKFHLALTSIGVSSVFNAFVDREPSEVGETAKIKLLTNERKVIQCNLSGHPVEAIRSSLSKNLKETTIASLVEAWKDEENDDMPSFGHRTRIVLSFEGMRKLTTKTGNEMLMFTFSDETGTISGVQFSGSNFETYRKLLGSLVTVNGEFSMRNNEPSIRVNADSDGLRMLEVSSYILFIDKKSVTTEKINWLKEEASDGDVMVVLVDTDAKNVKTQNFTVDIERAKECLPVGSYIFHVPSRGKLINSIKRGA